MRQNEKQDTKSTTGEKTALVLGGGGSRGAYEIGVWKALREMGQPIHMTAGTSVGSLNAAIIAQSAELSQDHSPKQAQGQSRRQTHRQFHGQAKNQPHRRADEQTHRQCHMQAEGHLHRQTQAETVDLYRQAVDLWEQMDNQTIFSLSEPSAQTDSVKKSKGGLDGLRQRLETCLDEDSIRKSPLAMGLVTVEIPKLSPLYLWIEDIPRGKLMDYILASCSCFPAVGSYEIDGKKYVDGGYLDNMPVRMALERGADQIIAVDLNSFGVVRRHTMENACPGKHLTVIQSRWDLGNFLAFEQNNIKKIMRLGYLDTLKTYGAYDGMFYCFFKGECDKRTLKSMEAAARIFQLPPTLLYSRKRFIEMLAYEVQAYDREQAEELRDINRKLPSDFLDSLLTLIRQMNSKTLTLAAAQGMKKGGRQKELLLSRPVQTLFSDEIRAASWLVGEGLI